MIPRSIALLVATLFVAFVRLPADAYPTAATISFLSGSAVSFLNPPDNIDPAWAASSALSLSVKFSTTPSTGAGAITIVSPSVLTPTSGAIFSTGIISVSCNPGGAAGYTGATVTLVPGGTSSPCITVAAGVHNGNATVTVTFTLDASKPIADTYAATAGFSFVGTAS
jgi:hypothetical protein